MCCKKKNDLRQWMGMPLALVGLLMSGYLIGAGTYGTYTAINSHDWAEISAIIYLVLNLIKIICGLIGAVSILAKVAGGVHFIAIAAKIVLAASVVSIVTNIVVWVSKLIKGDAGPNSKELTNLVVSMVLDVILVLVIPFIMNAILSLHMVVAYGGTGWEKKSYKDLRGGNDEASQSSSDSDSLA